MTTIYEALNLIDQKVNALSSEILPIENSLGRIVFSTIFANLALPSFNNSAMDGYGLKGETDKYLLVGKLLAGDGHDYVLNDGECISIMTGAKVPFSVDTVIQQEFTTTKDRYIHIQKSVKKGANIRQKGEDINVGDMILDKGEKIYSSHIGLLSSQGITHVEVYKKPKVAVFAGGSELKLHFEKLENAQVFNSNTPHLIAKSDEFGCEGTFIGKVDDNIEALKELIQSCLEYDLLITSGGMSVGEADFTKDAFKELGMEMFFSKIDIKPGRPTAFGKIASTYILNLPGNPLASILNYEIFGKNITAKLSGAKNCHHNFIETKISDDYLQSKQVDTVIPGTFDGVNFTKVNQFKSGMVNVLNHCNGLIIVNRKTKTLKKGDKVKFLPIQWEFQSDKYLNVLS